MVLTLHQLRSAGLVFNRNVSVVVTPQFYLQKKSQLFYKHTIKGFCFKEEPVIFNPAPPTELTREPRCSEHPNLVSLSTFFFVSSIVDTNVESKNQTASQAVEWFTLRFNRYMACRSQPNGIKTLIALFMRVHVRTCVHVYVCA